MTAIEARLKSFFAEVEEQGGDYYRAFKRFATFQDPPDSKISYDEYRGMIARWNSAVVNRDLISALFRASDHNEDGFLDQTEFIDSNDVLQQFDTGVLITVYIRPKMLTKERFGIVIEEVTYL
jgi:hypothetical protein